MVLFDEFSIFKLIPEGVSFEVKVFPKASHNKIGPTATNAKGIQFLKIYITQAAEDGKANKAIIDLLAKSWELTKSDITIKHGLLMPQKVLEVRGEPETLRKKLNFMVRGPFNIETQH